MSAHQTSLGRVRQAEPVHGFDLEPPDGFVPATWGATSIPTAYGYVGQGKAHAYARAVTKQIRIDLVRQVRYCRSRLLVNSAKTHQTHQRSYSDSRAHHCAGCGQVPCIKNLDCSLFFFDEIVREAERQRQLGNRDFAEAVVKALDI